ncbi:MAG: thiamine diphosphokinase [Tannerellaceae bacterium]|nr:thiamine diphosphokinase [Tannerellaceae bacterium]
MIAPYNCVIVANGSFPTAKVPLKLLKEASVVIACDGAICSLHKAGIIPQAIVGDMDSIPEELRLHYANLLVEIVDQEINDLTKAVLQARNMGQEEILILGATGLREDHTVGNISLLAEYMPHFRRVEMATDFGWFTSLSTPTEFNSFPGQQVSIFSLNPLTKLTFSGLRWPVKDRTLTSWWQGSLNEATGDHFHITFEGEANLIIFRTYP